MRLKKLLAVALCAGMLTLSTQAEALKFFAQADGMTASNTPYGDNASAAHRVQVGDAKIYYESYGQGDPIVLLHGGGLGSAYEMGCFADPLKPSFRAEVMVAPTSGTRLSPSTSAPTISAPSLKTQRSKSPRRSSASPTAATPLTPLPPNIQTPSKRSSRSAPAKFFSPINSSSSTSRIGKSTTPISSLNSSR